MHCFIPVSFELYHCISFNEPRVLHDVCWVTTKVLYFYRIIGPSFRALYESECCYIVWYQLIGHAACGDPRVGKEENLPAERDASRQRLPRAGLTMVKGKGANELLEAWTYIATDCTHSLTNAWQWRLCLWKEIGLGQPSSQSASQRSKNIGFWPWRPPKRLNLKTYRAF